MSIPPTTEKLTLLAMPVNKLPKPRSLKSKKRAYVCGEDEDQPTRRQRLRQECMSTFSFFTMPLNVISTPVHRRRR